MAKAVFRDQELKKAAVSVALKSAKVFEPLPVSLAAPPEVYAGPTANQLREEAEAFRVEWEIQKAKMISDAEQEARDILVRSEEHAAHESERIRSLVENAEKENEEKAAQLVESAKAASEELVKSAETKREEIAQSAYNEGREKGNAVGYEDGYKTGDAEVQRLIDRLHVILERVYQKRDNILVESERELVNLVLLISRKVVKTISDSERDVITANVLEALQKVKSRSDVTVRVNLADLQLTTEHVDAFIKSVENVAKIHVVEDTTVDRGGCVVETDFGEIDARIASQLAEIEKKILELTPVKDRVT
ncbi:MAG: flagellar assembly protein FliH [Spirochaetaceae bacterium]|jgi:flagellar assembly protein FliH|nr:flagellar assembly protein FliH [Spirochaetaceae bacterium]